MGALEVECLVWDRDGLGSSLCLGFAVVLVARKPHSYLE
jgi:hypothetical protein